MKGILINESIYEVDQIGNHYFMARIVEQNGNQLHEEEQIITPYRTDGMVSHGFEIWINE